MLLNSYLWTPTPTGLEMRSILDHILYRAELLGTILVDVENGDSDWMRAAKPSRIP